jgi:flavorubredoxin
MKTANELYSSGKHRWIVVSRDPEQPPHLVDTNEYVVVDGNDALLTDPGGMEIFPAVFAALGTKFDVRCISHVFASHQDPDVISSLPLWLDFNPAIRCYVSWLWRSFVPHFGGGAETFIPLPDEGAPVRVGTSTLTAMPAHFLHSPGNFHLYDPEARILFSGDVGSAMLERGDDGSYMVTDFDAHIRHAEGFHRRWMPSNEARLAWCERVSQMQIDFLCPQHGKIYSGADVGRFIDWFSNETVAVLKKSG